MMPSHFFLPEHAVFLLRLTSCEELYMLANSNICVVSTEPTGCGDFIEMYHLASHTESQELTVV